jgi:DNA-binding CsgD family transcriptional regulator
VCETIGSVQLTLVPLPSNQCIDLLDCLNLDSTAALALIDSCGDSPTPHSAKQVLFNVAERADLSALKIDSLWGLFYKNDSHILFLKGMRAILSNRRFLQMTPAACSRKSQAAAGAKTSGLQGLSAREKEILRLIADGRMNNDDIAANLAISIHTVKTHVYRCFKKLGVNTRLKLVRWSADHLAELTRDG